MRTDYSCTSMHTRFIIIWIANINFELDSDLKPVDLNLDWVDLTTYFAPARGAKYCDERVCMSVRSHISKTTRPNFTKIFCAC